MKSLSILACCLLVFSTSSWAAPQTASRPDGGAAKATPQNRSGAAAGPWWSTWRGPEGTGAASTGNPPVTWSEQKNIKWKVAIPGLGISTPVIWKDRIYLTTAIKTDRDGKPTAKPAPARDDQGGRRGRGGRRGGRRRWRGFGGTPPTKIHEFAVMALDRKDGRIVWRTKVKEAVPHEAGHRTATQASNSPLTDGEHIYASFGSRGIYCLDLQGKVVWSKDYGLMRTRFGFGEGASPALFGNTLVVNWDHEGESFLVALDKSTGKELWRRPRDEHTTWDTPLIVTVGERAQVIITGTKLSRAYDLQTGKLIWSCPGMTPNCIPSPIYKDGVAYLMSGFRGAALQAIRLDGAQGDLADSKNLVWSHSRGTSYVPSALLYDGFMYFLRSNNGILSCIDASTGKVFYEGQKLQGIRSIYGSPVGAGGHVYVTGREGTTKVLALGPKFEELASNKLDDGFDASAAIVGDELYLRGREHLYCIAKQD